jgi:hypothetical protein
MEPSLLTTIVARLAPIAGLRGIVLGGSRGRGTARPDSDVDIGLYFESPEAFDIAALNRAARELDDEHREGLCTQVGGWGPWVTGGGWLRIGGQPVDLIYRELPRVARVIDECLAGRITIGYQAGHPFGFPSSIYAGEVATCQVLLDPDGALAKLKSKTRPYPPALAKATIDLLAWEAGFCAAIAEKPARRGDLYYVAGTLFRGASCLTQTLFALNGAWWLNEKGAVALAAALPRCPPRYAERANAVFAAIGTDALAAIAELRALDNDVQSLLKT